MSFWISVLDFVFLQSLVQKQISLNSGQKLPGLDIFGLELEIDIITFEIAPSNFPDLKFCEIIKILKYGTNNNLFGYLLAGILKIYCHTWNQHPWICQKQILNSYSEF